MNSPLRPKPLLEGVLIRIETFSGNDMFLHPPEGVTVGVGRFQTH